MKKNLLIILLISIMPVIVNAAPTGSSSCSSSGKVSLNNTITVTVSGSSSEAMWHTTLSYDTSKLQYISGSGLQHISDDFVTGITYTYTFKAVAEGTAYVKTSSSISDYDGEKAFPTSNCSINIVKASENSNNNVKKSSDNSLSNLLVENVDLTPKFSKEVYEYTATVENEIDKINIIAKTNHSKASVTGKGEQELVEGENIFKIVVKAENGSTRTYTINITRKEKNPIIVKIEGIEYSLLRNLKDIEIPDMFEETTIKVDNEEVPAFKYKNYALVVLRDNENNINFYNYEKGKYTIFNQIISDNINFVLLEMEKVPTNYKKLTIKLNGNNIEGYKISGDSRILLYGLNMLTGEKNYYTYDRSEKTLQLFDVDLYENNISTNKNNMYCIYGLSLGTLFLFILNILLINKNKKQKKLIQIVKEKVIETEEKNDNKKIEKKVNVQEEIIEEVKEENPEKDSIITETDDFWDEPKRKRKKK